MTDTLAVLLDDAVAGSLTRLAGGRLRFDYDDGYRRRAAATPLSVSMPLSVRSHADSEITPWLWGLLPDNDRVLSRWAREFHAAAKPFSLLSTPIGHDCAGAVSFAPSEQAPQLLTEPGRVVWLTDEQLARRLRELREDATSWLGREFTGQFSLAGAQAKTALLLEDGRWGVPSGSAATSHILKPAVQGLDDHDLNEHLCLDAAGRAGLVVAHTHVARFNDESAVVVARYDRQLVNGHLVRIHQEDTCQALTRHPDQKYQRDGGPSPGDLAALFRAVMPPRVAEDAVWRFLDALIWNWLIAGTDAHAKNYSLLLIGNDVRLAPLYDIASALPYGMDEHKLRFAMKIGGDYRVYPYRNTWQKAAEELRLEADRVLERVVRLALMAPDALADAAHAPAVAALGRPLPGRLVDLVADRVKRCLATLPQSAKAQATRTMTYQERLGELSDAVAARPLPAEAVPGLVRDAALALRATTTAEPRDLGAVREGIFELAVAALQAIHAVGEAEKPPGYVNPTRNKLAGLISDYAPGIASLLLPDDDPVARVVDEIVQAADRYAGADPRSTPGAADERLRALYRAVGLAARALSLRRPLAAPSPGPRTPDGST
jgi:serine/threonine-protein kinase HipA